MGGNYLSLARHSMCISLHMINFKNCLNIRLFVVASAFSILGLPAWGDDTSDQLYISDDVVVNGDPHKTGNVVFERTESGSFVSNPSRPENGVALLTEAQLKMMNREAYIIFERKHMDNASIDNAAERQKVFDNIAATEILYLKLNVGDAPELNYFTNKAWYDRLHALRNLKLGTVFKPEQRKQLARISQLDPDWRIRERARSLLLGRQVEWGE